MTATRSTRHTSSNLPCLIGQPSTADPAKVIQVNSMCTQLFTEPILKLRSYTCHMESRSVTCHLTHVWTCPDLISAKVASIRFTYPEGMGGWVVVYRINFQWYTVVNFTIKAKKADMKTTCIFTRLDSVNHATYITKI